MTFMQAHIRDSRIRGLVRSAAKDADFEIQQAASILLKADSDTRGTIAAMSQEVDEAAEIGEWSSVVYCLHSPILISKCHLEQLASVSPSDLEILATFQHQCSAF